MNNQKKVILLTIMMIVIAFSSFALESTLTLRGGISGAQTDIIKDKDYNGMLGLSYEVWMAKWLSLGLYPYVTKVGAGLSTEPNFQSNMVGGDLLLKLRPHWTVIAPYVMGGGGVVNFFPKNKNGDQLGATPNNLYDYTVAVLPTVGAGIDIFTNFGIDFELGVQKNFMNSDYLDNVKRADAEDSYWMAYLGLSHTFGKTEEMEPVMVPEPEPEIPVIEEKIPELKVTPMEKSVMSDAGSTGFRVDSNTAWTVTEYEDWLSANPTSGNGNANFNVNYDANPTRVSRTGYVQVSGEGLSQTLTIMQEGMPLPPLSLKMVHFDFNKYNLTDEAMSILDEDVVNLGYYPDVKVEVQGYCDIIGGENYNLRLSERRADTVRDYLVSKGIDASRLSVAYFGKSDPIAPNDTEEGRAQNRRAELAIK